MFVSEDPIKLLGGDNTYQHAPDPIEWVDPYGFSSYALGKSMMKNGRIPLLGIFNRSRWQAHHLIPEEVWKNNKKFLRKIGMKGKGKGRDSWTNGVFLPDYEDIADLLTFIVEVMIGILG